MYNGKNSIESDVLQCNVLMTNVHMFATNASNQRGLVALWDHKCAQQMEQEPVYYYLFYDDSIPIFVANVIAYVEKIINNNRLIVYSLYTRD